MKSTYTLRTAVNDLELLLLVTLTFLFFMYYGVVSHLSSFRGVNTAYFLVTPLDELIPYQDFWILFYSLAELVPMITILLIRVKIGADMPVFRSVVITIFAFLFINYLLYLLFPCSVIDMFGVPKSIWAHNFLENLVRMDFSTEAPWNANPSLHIGFSWIVFRFFSVYFKKALPRIIFLIWFTGMAIGTLALKVHIIANVFFGLILAEVCFRYIFKSTAVKVLADYLGGCSLSKRFGLYLLFGILLLLGLHCYRVELGPLMIIK